jgi:hypothetical protein
VTTKTTWQLATLVTLILAVAFMPSCARDQTLTSMTLTPSSVTFEGVGAAVQMTAIGTFEHPFATKEVTNQVQWSIDSQHLATVTASGLVTSINVCGSGNVVAKYLNPPGSPSGSVMLATAALAGSGQGTPTCNSATVTVGIMGSVTPPDGSVTSSPAGISCPGTCTATYSLGAQVVLTAAGAGFGGWQGCDTLGTTPNICILNLNGSRNPTATYN